MNILPRICLEVKILDLKKRINRLLPADKLGLFSDHPEIGGRQIKVVVIVASTSAE